MNRASHIQALLEKDPRLLVELYDKLTTQPPKLLRPWEPNLTINEDEPFLVTRATLNGDRLFILTPQKGKGHRGPWKLVIIDDRKVLDDHMGTRLRACADNEPLGYGDGFTLIDRCLAEDGFTLIDHVYPDIVFEPWTTTDGMQYQRHIRRLDGGMWPDFKVSIDSDPKGGWTYDIHEMPGVRHSEFAGVTREAAANKADLALINLGYNMARPTSYDHITRWGLSDAALRAAQNKSWGAR